MEITGRSDLSWDDSVRIDVRYVENWSLSFHLVIAGRPSVPSCAGAAPTEQPRPAPGWKSLLR
ncbi:MAG: hypothetical protein M3Q22_01885 [Actinomycetota bacterium]|nr:hypothetical protein [Actinomycetota bacterium]